MVKASYLERQIVVIFEIPMKKSGYVGVGGKLGGGGGGGGGGDGGGGGGGGGCGGGGWDEEVEGMIYRSHGETFSRDGKRLEKFKVKGLDRQQGKGPAFAAADSGGSGGSRAGIKGQEPVNGDGGSSKEVKTARGGWVQGWKSRRDGPRKSDSGKKVIPGKNDSGSRAGINGKEPVNGDGGSSKEVKTVRGGWVQGWKSRRDGPRKSDSGKRVIPGKSDSGSRVGINGQEPVNGDGGSSKEVKTARGGWIWGWKSRRDGPRKSDSGKRLRRCLGT